MTKVHVEAAVAGRRRAGADEHVLHIALPGGPTSLADIIGAIVRSEVAAFLERAEGERVVRVLTEATLAEGLAAGTVRSGGREIAADVDPETAVVTALDAQRDGLYQAIVDDEPIDDLGAILDLRDGTKVAFLRFVPLAGG